MATTTRSVDCGLSPEIEWYLESRGIPYPTCPPKFRTPEPREVEGAVFDGERVDKVLRSFRVLKHTQGKWARTPLTPDPWQVAYILAPIFGWVRLNDDGRYVRIIRKALIDIPRKNGKGLYAGEMILTADGWKKFGDLVVGDRVHSIDGSLTEVTYVSPEHELDCYRVTFGDGQSLVCDGDHLWTVWDRHGHDPDAWAESKAKGAWRTISTPELAAKHRVGARNDTRFSVRMDRILERPTADLPIDPYLLGAWLGDGASAQARMTTADPPIWKAFQAAGYTVRPVGKSKIEYGISGGLLAELRSLGVLGNKHVPDRYLVADADQRVALLRGLMDTDGSVIRGRTTPRVEFSNTRRSLADAVLFLARSLGWKPTIIERRAMLNGVDCGPMWRVTWTAYNDRSPFGLDRKSRILFPPPARPTRAATNVVTSVERVPTVTTKCIQVAHPSAQFLAGEGLIPTHNTTIAGGVALYLTGADGEEGAQVYTVAASKGQANFCFAPIKALAEGTPALKEHFRTLVGKVLHPRSGSYLTVASSVGDLLHGANVSGAVIDELHVHKTRDVVDAVETGTGSREQPLILTITTADDGRVGSIYAEKRALLERCARGAISTPSFYGVVWAAESTDNPFVEETWKKANPGFGISPTREYMVSEAEIAQQSPASKSRFCRLNLGIRTKQETKYLELDDWRRNTGPPIIEADLTDRKAYGGLDLAATSDLCSLAWDFPDGRGGHDVLWRHWCPEDALDKLIDRTAGQAAVWVAEGWLTLTPGNVADYDYILEAIGRDLTSFAVQAIGYDPWNSTSLVTSCMNLGAPMVTVRQGFATMSGPTKDLLQLVKAGTAEKPLYRHGGNPLLEWQVDNFAVELDAAGNVKPSKKNAGDKIDGVVAGIMALARATSFEEQVQPSKYETENMVTM